jgi:hypothetical protein
MEIRKRSCGKKTNAVSAAEPTRAMSPGLRLIDAPRVRAMIARTSTETYEATDRSRYRFEWRV